MTSRRIRVLIAIGVGLANAVAFVQLRSNIPTFNPGWDRDTQPLATFTDVRELQRQLRAQGVQLVSEADESTAGPASIVVVDPDGNPVLVDQHV